MIKVLVFGAGAIGRGYVPWLFDSNHLIDFVDANSKLISELKNEKHYVSFMIKDGAYVKKVVEVGNIYHIDEVNPQILDDYDFIITAVGPRQFMGLSELFKQSAIPIVCFENDRNLVSLMRSSTSRANIYFGIPDVISSNSTSKELQEQYKNSLITEDGQTFVESGAVNLGGDITYVDETEIAKQWAAKLYIHNTPHCIAAYLGSLIGAEFLHEAMQNRLIDEIVTGVAAEMAEMTRKEYGLTNQFSMFYLNKEITRFKNVLLCDPIKRIAREPFRKLALSDRLIGAASKAIVNNVNIENTLTGIIAAFSYDDPSDPDKNIKILFNSLGKEDFLNIAIGLAKHEVVYQLLLKNWDSSLKLIEEVKHNV